MPAHQDRSGIALDTVRHAAHERGLARAVRPNDADEFAELDFQVDVRKGFEASKILGHVLDVENNVRVSSQSARLLHRKKRSRSVGGLCDFATPRSGGAREGTPC